MARLSPYRTVIVESFVPVDRVGRRGEVHIRPIAGQVFATTLFVECSKRLMDATRYPLGTKFKLQAKLTDRQGGVPFLYAYHGDPDIMVTDDEAAKFLSGLQGGKI